MLAHSVARRAARSAAFGATPAGARGLAVDALEPGRAIVWGRGSLGMRPSEGISAQISSMSITATKPTELNTLTDQSIRNMTFGLNGGAALTEGGKLWTWGTNKHVLGLGGKVAAVPVPRPVKAVAAIDLTAVAMGERHAAAISSDGLLFTWGYGGFPFWKQGALGHGDKVDQSQPALVAAFVDEETEEPKRRVVQVECGTDHTVCLTHDGVVWAFGEGESGLLGSGMLAASSPRAVDFEEEGVRCVKVAVGGGFSLALDVHGQVWGWGRNGYGQLGLGEDAAVDIQAAESIPTRLPHFPEEEESIVDIAAGGRCSIALGKSGQVYVWGDRLHMRPFNVSHFVDNDLLLEGETIVRVRAGHGAFGVLTSHGRVFTFGKSSISGATGQSFVSGSVTPALLSGLGPNTAADLVLGGKSGAVITGTPPSAIASHPVPFESRA